jgi:hypothetical protein
MARRTGWETTSDARKTITSGLSAASPARVVGGERHDTVVALAVIPVERATPALDYARVAGNRDPDGKLSDVDDKGIDMHPRAADEASDRVVESFAVVRRWLFSEPMAELLDLFGERMPAVGAAWEQTDDLASWLHLNEELPDWLEPLLDGMQATIRGLSTEQTDVVRRALMVERLCADDFNFRGAASGEYRERVQASSADFDEEQRDRVSKLTDQLGLVTPQQPRYDRYEHTLVLGGGGVSPLLRARYAKQLQLEGIHLGRLAFLGSPRPLLEDPPERPRTESYAPGARDEFDLMIGGARTEFAARPGSVTQLCGCATTSELCPKWRFANHEKAGQTPAEFTHERMVELLDEGGTPVGFAVSPSTSRPPYRPDTSDTFGLWTRLADPQPRQKTLVVTTQVFVPFQTFDGLRLLYLPYGLDVDTVGFGPDWGDRPMTAEYLLQETLSGIRSARRLLIDGAAVLGAR